VPFNVKVPVQTSGGTAQWVGEGKPKPLTKFDFTQLTLGFNKVAAIAVISEELIRHSSPSAELLVRNSLICLMA
jgi:HK97 family phage major capsid protein